MPARTNLVIKDFSLRISLTPILTFFVFISICSKSDSFSSKKRPRYLWLSLYCVLLKYRIGIKINFLCFFCYIYNTSHKFCHQSPSHLNLDVLVFEGQSDQGVTQLVIKPFGISRTSRIFFIYIFRQYLT